MKTGIVMSIEGGTAVVMLPGGVFEDTAALPGWQKGDVVGLRKPRNRSLSKLVTLAACLVLVLLGGIGGARAYFTETSVIGVDINPSFELRLNCFGKVIDAASYNEDGMKVIEEAGIKRLSYGKALDRLFQSEAMTRYLDENSIMAFSVYSSDREQELLRYMEALAASINARYGNMNAHCVTVDKAAVETAHRHGMTAGKLEALRELQEYLPDLVVDEYAHCGLGEIYRQIEDCRGNRHGQHYAGENAGNEDPGGNGNSTGAPAESPDIPGKYGGGHHSGSTETEPRPSPSVPNDHHNDYHHGPGDGYQGGANPSPGDGQGDGYQGGENPNPGDSQGGGYQGGENPNPGDGQGGGYQGSENPSPGDGQGDGYQGGENPSPGDGQGDGYKGGENPNPGEGQGDGYKGGENPNPGDGQGDGYQGGENPNPGDGQGDGYKGGENPNLGEGQGDGYKGGENPNPGEGKGEAQGVGYKGGGEE